MIVIVLVKHDFENGDETNGRHSEKVDKCKTMRCEKADENRIDERP